MFICPREAVFGGKMTSRRRHPLPEGLAQCHQRLPTSDWPSDVTRGDAHVLEPPIVAVGKRRLAEEMDF